MPESFNDKQTNGDGKKKKKIKKRKKSPGILNWNLKNKKMEFMKSRAHYIESSPRESPFNDII